MELLIQFGANPLLRVASVAATEPDADADAETESDGEAKVDGAKSETDKAAAGGRDRAVTKAKTAAEKASKAAGLLNGPTLLEFARSSAVR